MSVLPSYLDILSCLINDDEPVYALISSEINDLVTDTPHSTDSDKCHIRNCVIQHCVDMIANGHVNLLWEYDKCTPSLKEKSETLIRMHMSAPIGVYTFTDAPSYFYQKYGGDYVLSITEAGRALLNETNDEQTTNGIME